MRTDLNYSPSDCFETFSFPSSLDGLEAIGERYHAYRQQIMLTRREGLTKTYNRFHAPDEISADIQKLRELHVEMDNAVAAAYGWSDLPLDHGFHETKQGVRYTISEAARREVLARLLTLNHERYADEVRRGLHEAKAKRPTTSKPKVSAPTQKAAVEQTLFDLDEAFPTTKRDKLLCGLFCDLVAAQPGLSATAYMDMLVIALRHERLNRLLIGDDRTQFTALAKKAFKGIGQSDKPLSWAEVVRVLSLQKAIVQQGSTLVAGAEFDAMRKLHPACDPKLIALLHKAGATLREHQGVEETDASMAAAAESQEMVEVVREFAQFRLEDFTDFGVAA